MKTQTISAIIITLSLAACGENYSNGIRVGTVIKLSEKGLFFKSWEATVDLGGSQNYDQHDTKGRVTGSSLVRYLWEVNVEPSAVPKMQKALSDTSRVELVYKQWAIAPIRIGSNYVITDIKNQSSQ